MPTPPVSNQERARRKAVIETLLREGYHPQGSTGGIASATKEAERREGVNFPRWCRWEEVQRDMGMVSYAVDWSLYSAPAVVETPAEEGSAPVEIDPNATWSDFSFDGWLRAEANDEVEEFTTVNKKGETKSAMLRTFDPGVQYPVSWSGPFLTDNRSHFHRPSDGVKRWLVTGAQDKTPVHGPFMVNLEAYADYLDTEILVLGVTYARDVWSQIFGTTEDRKSAKTDIQEWSSAIRDRIVNSRVKLGDVQVCGEVNTSPTAERPLSGLLTYGKNHSCVFAHPKQELESVPRAAHLDPVLCWTTGFCTPPSYVQRKAGLKAAFHHVIGAVIIEQDVDGKTFVRHIHADPQTGSFQDLDIKVDKGLVSTGNRVRAITYGDIHAEHLDPEIEMATWRADDSLQKLLRPEHVFIHDVLDFFSRNHHNRNDPWHAAEVMRRGLTVAQEIKKVADFLGSIRQAGTTIHTVESNHDLALARWVRENDWRTDLLNAPLQLELALAQANAINAQQDISLFEFAVKRLSGDTLDDIDFLREDQSFVVDGIECGWHGHNGPNGSRGTTQGYLRLATKMSKGHDHSPTKRQGVCSAGTKQKINPMPRWAKGPTTWAHADVVIYEGGRSSHVIFSGNRWKAVGNRALAQQAA